MKITTIKAPMEPPIIAARGTLEEEDVPGSWMRDPVLVLVAVGPEV
jgi:hypothetical protein